MDGNPRSSGSESDGAQPMLGFKPFKRAAQTVAGIELFQRLRKGQFDLANLGVQGQAAPHHPDRGAIGLKS